jgi:hypothetical protein
MAVEGLPCVQGSSSDIHCHISTTTELRWTASNHALHLRQDSGHFATIAGCMTVCGTLMTVIAGLHTSDVCACKQELSNCEVILSTGITDAGLSQDLPDDTWTETSSQLCSSADSWADMLSLASQNPCMLLADLSTGVCSIASQAEAQIPEMSTANIVGLGPSGPVGFGVLHEDMHHLQVVLVSWQAS